VSGPAGPIDPQNGRGEVDAGGTPPDGPPAGGTRDSARGRERARAELAARSGAVVRRSLGSPILFTIVYSSLASALYFSLGVIAGHALGLTPLVFLISAGLFWITAMTYVEGAALHPERGGSTVFARYAFNELVSFVAGWAILLDYIILIAVTAYSATQYLRVFWSPLGGKGAALGLALAFIGFIVLSNIRGFTHRRARRVGALMAADLFVQAVIVVIGLVLFFNFHKLFGPIHLGTAPTWSHLIFALTIAVIAFTSLESASGLSAEVKISRTGLRHLVASTTGTVAFLYVGIALVALTALPVHDGRTLLATHYVNDPMIGIVVQFHPHWVGEAFKYLVGALAAVTLVAAANSAMMGLSRLAYSLSTNRQVPSALGRLHPQRSTPYVIIVLAGVIAAGLVASEDLDFLVGIYAFGATLAFTIAHLSIIRLRYTEADRDRPYRVPLSVRARGGLLPIPAVIGAAASAAGWVAVIVLHEPARYVGLGWLLVGLTMYVVYRRADEAPLLRRVTVPASALRPDTAREREYGSILVPLFGTDIDDDIVQTAALLVAGEPTDEAAIDAATIEALWFFVIPMALPLDASLPEAQLRHARQVLARAKAIGEEYTGVEVATATVRTRRAGFAIVEEARRRGVEAIVMGAEGPPEVRGGSILGGLGGARESYVGDVTKYVVAKAPCRVIVTAPAGRDSAVEQARRPQRTGASIV
jgi:basic amino acid/polyamine antiporter, APA family